MNAILVLDVGKTNVKLSAAEPDGRLIETLSTPNPVLPGPPYPHHDLDRIEDWLLDGMRALGKRHAVEALVACGHGSGGVLVGEDGALLPMVDYEQAASPPLDAAYRAAVGPSCARLLYLPAYSPTSTRSRTSSPSSKPCSAPPRPELSRICTTPSGTPSRASPRTSVGTASPRQVTMHMTQADRQQL